MLATPAAAGSIRTPRQDHLHGEEGVDGSSPSEGSAKDPQSGAYSFGCTCTINSVRWVWSPLWSLQVEPCPRNAPNPATSRSGATSRRDTSSRTAALSRWRSRLRVPSLRPLHSAFPAVLSWRATLRLDEVPKLVEWRPHG